MRVPIGEVARDHFPVYERDRVTKKSGETSFFFTVWKDSAQYFISPTISEIGNSGEYTVSFIPPSKGQWSVEVYSEYSGDVWYWGFSVYEDAQVFLNVAYDKDTSLLYATFWLERDGSGVFAPVSGEVVITEVDGDVVLSQASSVADPQGRFTVSGTVTLVTERVYQATARVTDSKGQVSTLHSLSTAG